MFKSRCLLLIAAVIASLCVRPASAIVFEFDTDVDSFTPQSASPNQTTPFNNYDANNDPNLDGAPPQDYDWRDIRTGASGVLEEVPSGFEGVTSSSGSTHGVMYGSGSHGFPDPANPALGEWSYQMDLFIDPRMKTSQQASTNHGTPDFWWTNSIGPGYLTESGFSPEVQPDGPDIAENLSPAAYWDLRTTNGVHVANGILGTWVTLETYFHESETRPGKIAATHKVWNQDHTELLGSVTLNTLFLDPNVSAYGGSGYSWLPLFEPNIHHLTLDRLGIGPPIELVVGFVLGDMDGDGDLDNFDIQPLELALTNRPLWESTYGLNDAHLRGDIDQDGDLDNFDIQPFEDLLTGGGPLGAAAAVPEPSTLLLLGFGGMGLAMAARRRKR